MPTCPTLTATYKTTRVVEDFLFQSSASCLSGCLLNLNLSPENYFVLLLSFGSIPLPFCLFARGDYGNAMRVWNQYQYLINWTTRITETRVLLLKSCILFPTMQNKQGGKILLCCSPNLSTNALRNVFRAWFNGAYATTSRSAREITEIKQRRSSSG